MTAKPLFLPFVVMLALAMVSTCVGAAQLPANLEDIAHTWAHVTYEVPPADQDAAYQALEARVERLVQANPADADADAKVWLAIILSTHAGEHGGLGALGMAKQARTLLEQAQAIRPDALDGSIYTTLGSLYDHVPGWPLGFGDKDKARALLLKALQVNPDGIDSNYFYADFLYRHGDRAGALAAVKKALAAAPRPDQPLADRGRRAQAEKLLQTIQSNS
ncbi:hypothetical protein ATSB10_26790 [Dyella thiooxydans]|uniref:Uncharacterized protein n=1 Tax=Dyella thiooxydans TaxID=445710 RepID=A0A160N2K4_9GAMM|nr:hypothetical protein [Dyella thiooxydans]AND70133.1 hypothetical protein ATSB10_26790 [Dyella thiooxydans]